jgi:uridine kinase
VFLCVLAQNSESNSQKPYLRATESEQSMRHPFVIGITGGSGSGKTSFIRKLRESFPAKDVCIISQDDYYRPRDEQARDHKDVHNFDLPGSIYDKDLLRDLRQLLKGESVSRPMYTFNNPLATPEMLHFQSAPVIIIEGLFIFYFDAIRNLMDLKVFVHAKENLKVIRRIMRDQTERNYPLDDVLYRYQHHVLPAFEQYIEPFREESDVVINNNSDFDSGLRLIQGFIRHLVG